MENIREMKSLFISLALVLGLAGCTEPEVREVEVEVTPQVCIDALDAASEGFLAVADSYAELEMLNTILAEFLDEIYEVLETDGYITRREWIIFDEAYANKMDAYVDMDRMSIGHYDSDVLISASQECRRAGL
jgi:predicted Zn-dependent protease